MFQGGPLRRHIGLLRLGALELGLRLQHVAARRHAAIVAG